jgi:3-phenylpropionate/trans-cinnamate dioxygenase ferredoxin component
MERQSSRYATEDHVFEVCALADLPPGESTRVLAHVPVAVFNADGELFAIDDTCTHQDASLSEGWLEDCTIECPLHAASFDLRTGKPTGPPAKRPVRTYATVVHDGLVYVDAPVRGAPIGAPAPAEGAPNAVERAESAQVQTRREVA